MVADFSTAKPDRSGGRNTYDPGLNGRCIFVSIHARHFFGIVSSVVTKNWYGLQFCHEVHK